MGWGGRRPGAGRKRKSRRVNGKADVVQHPSSPLPPRQVGPVAMPDGLTGEEVEVWEEQAPHAIANGTLTQAQARAFATYCKLRALESHNRDGDNTHIALVKTINTYELQFLLAPCGKPVPAAQPVEPEKTLTRFRR